MRLHQAQAARARWDKPGFRIFRKNRVRLRIRRAQLQAVPFRLTVHEAELYGMLEGASDAAVVIDQGGMIRFWNRSAEQLFGLPAKDAMNRPCAELVDGFDSAGARICSPERAAG